MYLLCSGDGFPRTVAQAEALEVMLKNLDKEISLLVDLKVSENELIDRLIIRGKTSGRSDDNIETIKKRLDVYHKLTEPVNDFYKNKNQYTPIDGMGTIEEIFGRISEVIDSKIAETYNFRFRFTMGFLNLIYVPVRV